MPRQDNFVNKIIDAVAGYQKQKEIEIHRLSWARLESAIESQHRHIEEYNNAVSKYAPKLLSTLQERDDYRSSRDSYFENITQLQNRLDALIKLAHEQPVTSKEELRIYKEILERGTSDLNKKATEVFQQLPQHMSGLLHSVAKVLLENKENNESSLNLGQLNIALLIDAINTENQSEQPSTTELVDLLKNLIAAEDLPKQCKHQLIEILTQIRFSPLNTPFVLHTLNETIKSIIEEPAQARANKIINSNVTPMIRSAVAIDTLVYELSDHFYLANFTAVFNSFIQTDKSNQEVLDEIRSRLATIESHASDCEALKSLVSEYRHKLQDLQSDAIHNPTLENYINLGKRLAELKNELETGAYFKSIQKVVHTYLTNLKNNLAKKLAQDEKTFVQLFKKLSTGSQQEKKLREFLTTDYEKTVSELEKWTNDINGYSKKTMLSEILKFSKLSEKETNAIYMPVYMELAEFRFLLTLLKDTNSDAKKAFTEINNPTEHTPRIKSLNDKLFFILNGAPSERIFFLKKLQQFFTVDKDPQQASDPFLLFKNEFRQAITKKCLETIFSPTRSLAKTHELLDDSTTEQNLIDFVAPKKAKDLFEATKNALKAFVHCSADIDNKKSSYTPSFFLKGDESKREAIKELIADLPLNTTQEVLDEKFRHWENKHSNTIDKPRYRTILEQLMVILHSIQTLFSGKVFETETRTLVNSLKDLAFQSLHHFNEVNENLTMGNL